MTTGGIDNLNLSRSAGSTRTTHAPMDRESARLRQACTDFEGVLLGMLLKQSLAVDREDEEGAQGNDILMDFGSEQVARDLGKSGTMGIADMMFKQMSRGAQSHGK